jgi:putative transposase
MPGYQKKEEKCRVRSIAFEHPHISMDGRGAWRDNVIVERLWRSVKYEEVYLWAYGGVSEARTSIGRYLGFFNGRRPHSSLAAKTPDQMYFDNLQVMMAA